MGGSDIPKMKNVHIWNIFHVRLPPLGFSGTLAYLLDFLVHTVKPLITNTSKEFIKCRLDNFSISFIYCIYVNFSICENK